MELNVVMAPQKKKSLDRIDCKILNTLQHNGRVSNLDLSREIGLSPTPCLERVRRLEREGYINGYTALVEPKYVGVALLVFIEVTLSRDSPDIFEKFNHTVLQRPEVQECHLVSGDFDYLLKARVADMDSYRQLLSELLLKLPYVSDTRTYVVMDEVKQSNHVFVKV
tara:strand:- start:1325 stop:1825 length:501 start_codon:yes stop_codon:yes gene_type:complete